MFINICVHSNYSLMSSSISIDDIINFAIKNNCEYASIMDINTMYGTFEFYKKVILAKLKPIIGLQILYNGQTKFLVAKNYDGVKNLFIISSNTMTNKPYKLDDFLDNIFVLNNDIAWRECNTINKDDCVVVNVLEAIDRGLLLSQIPKKESIHMLLDEEAAILFSKSQLDNLTEMLKSINIVFPEKYKNNFVKYKKNSDPNKIIYELCLNNANEIFNNKVPVEYKDRIDYEISIISQMGFSDYFLVVQDYVNYAKNNNISVGPGRGSAVGSLVSYLLKITEVDPIKHGLIFERFLNPDRIGMPDIDIDFEDAKRNMVTKYLYDKYGSEHIAHIITFQKMKAKMAIRDVGRVLEMPLIIINSIVKYFGFDNENDIVKAINDSKELKEFNNKYPLLFELSNRILNFPRQVGIHASGVIVSDEPLTNIIPIQTSSDIIYSTQCSMDYLEEMGLIKLDILGLSNLSSISQMIELIHKNYQKNINCLDIPLDDSLIFKKLSNGDTSGIFQLESPGMTNLIIRIKPTSIEDISICSALFRPGPQKNIPTYLFNKQNPNDIVYINDVFKKILSSTYGIIIYQEQVIEIIKEICNFSTAQSDTFRKIISKKQIEKMNKIKDEFISAAINNKYTLDQANEIFNYMYEFANYGFNHAHSIAYSYISYWLAWIKNYYPNEFFCVLLSSSINSSDKIVEYVNQLKKYGTKILPPDINYSKYDFATLGNDVLFGFASIKGLGNETISKILNLREKVGKYNDIIHCIGFLSTNGIGIKIVETMIKAGCMDSLLGDKTRKYFITNLKEIFEKSKMLLSTGEMLLKPRMVDVAYDNSDKQRENDEQKELLNISFEQHPIEIIKKQFTFDKKIEDFMSINKSNYIFYNVAKLVSYKIIKTKTGINMAMGKFEDETQIVTLAIFSGVYEKNKDLLQNNKTYLICVKTSDRGGQLLSIKAI